MFCKLLKNDLKKNMRLLGILFGLTIIFAGLTRGTKALGENIAFFKILSIFFDTVFYALVANALIQPFLKNITGFAKSFYGDESYLTHTLPVTKQQLLNSKFLTAIIEMLLGFATLVVSILIMFYSPTFFDTLKLLLSTIIIGDFSVAPILLLFIVLVIAEFLMFTSIIFFSIILAYKSKDKKVLKTFALTAAFAFASLTVLAVFMIIILSLNNINLSAQVMMLPKNAFVWITATGIVVYLAISTLFYFLAKKEFNKGVNID